ncbi:helix-turn-helix domain-containing protein [Zunongwangia sp. HGR-M22]|uniref:helix-turn-helix domain-containing protein n=1 Tax=Zunongwangia sp. HGR-M22 TaxID=3015168 RepID=UPI0022DE33B7|nr:helix-turn-helix transcriptional regulator [Zunongwangia sp. HGR-M22]WBL27255.1 helix-turn-helix transcriptional regulator [Zunongwangia sp. HGR-M22]
MSTATKNSHIGRKISRIRELRGMKQEALAAELGISQQSVSSLEQSEHIEDEKLERVAKALGVSKEAIENFNEDTIFNNINNFHDNSIQNNFNPVEKVIELYERLLEAEKEKNAYLEKLLDKK